MWVLKFFIRKSVSHSSSLFTKFSLMIFSRGFISLGSAFLRKGFTKGIISRCLLKIQENSVHGVRNEGDETPPVKHNWTVFYNDKAQR